jgi:predicted dinucleotide-binding enzyme
VQATGARAAHAAQATEGAQLVVVTIPLKAVPDLPDDLLSGAQDDVIVVDTCNYYPERRDGRIDAIEDGMTSSRWVSNLLGHPVIKVFNNIYSVHLGDHGRPQGAADRIALPVAGDEQEAKTAVMLLVDELGFDAIDAGTIDESWRQEPDTPVYGTDLGADGVRRALAEATPRI